MNGQAAAMFVAGDDAEARATVVDLSNELGFDTVDMGTLAAARYLFARTIGTGAGALKGHTIDRAFPRREACRPAIEPPEAVNTCHWTCRLSVRRRIRCWR